MKRDSPAAVRPLGHCLATGQQRMLAVETRETVEDVGRRLCLRTLEGRPLHKALHTSRSRNEQQGARSSRSWRLRAECAILQSIPGCALTASTAYAGCAGCPRSDDAVLRRAVVTCALPRDQCRKIWMNYIIKKPWPRRLKLRKVNEKPQCRIVLCSSL